MIFAVTDMVSLAQVPAASPGIKIIRIIWGAVAKTTGDPRVAPFVVLCRSSEQVYITSSYFCARQREKGGYYCYR